MPETIEAGCCVYHAATLTLMTVDEVRGDTVHCVYFVGATLYRESYRRDELILAREKQEAP
jgi:uncharacterized protein YodC (DUF2158 family)